MLPLSVFEELENGEAVLDTVVHDQVVQKLRVRALHQECAEEPAVTQNALLDIAGVHGITVHFGLAVGRSNLLGTLPFDIWHVHGVLRQMYWVIVERSVVCWEL